MIVSMGSTAIFGIPILIHASSSAEIGIPSHKPVTVTTLQGTPYCSVVALNLMVRVSPTLRLPRFFHTSVRLFMTISGSTVAPPEYFKPSSIWSVTIIPVRLQHVACTVQLNVTLVSRSCTSIVSTHASASGSQTVFTTPTGVPHITEPFSQLADRASAPHFRKCVPVKSSELAQQFVQFIVSVASRISPDIQPTLASPIVI